MWHDARLGTDYRQCFICRFVYQKEGSLRWKPWSQGSVGLNVDAAGGATWHELGPTGSLDCRGGHLVSRESGDGRGGWIGAGAVVVAAIIGGVFALLAANSDKAHSGPTIADNSTVTTNASTNPTDQGSTTTSEQSSALTDQSIATEDQPPALSHVESVKVQAGDYSKVGSGLYQLGGSRTLDFRYWWTTLTDNGAIDGSDRTCTVVITISNLTTRQVVDKQRSAACSFDGWYSANLPQGRYRLSVAVELESGARGSGSLLFTIVP
jgi:hypothetical protein